MEKTEVWRSLDFIGYPDYMISNFGRVKSLERVIIFKDGRKKLFPEKILKPNKKKNGYLQVVLCQNREKKSFSVHRLVCLIFLENPYNFPCVNHKDENKQNNHVDNLEWCTVKQNNCYGTKIERFRKLRKGHKVSEETKEKISEAKKIPILQYTLDGIFVRVWDSALSASIELNINKSSISACCKGKLKTSGGFIWKYKIK